MDPRDDAIETTTAFIWIDDGIIFEQANGVPSTSESVNEVFAAMRATSGGVPRPLLFDARKWPGGDVRGWPTAVTNLASSLTAFAMLIDPGSPVGVGPFPDAINRLLIPFRVFTGEAEALAYLRGFLPE